MRWSEFNLPKQISWRKTESCDAADAYCQKAETRAGSIFKWGFPEEPPKVKTLSVENFRPFQNTLKEILTGPVNDNKIIWVYDQIGQLGKTDFVRYAFSELGIPFSYGGKNADVINLAFNNKKYLLSKDNPGFIFNLSRDVDKISYNALEQLSDGCCSNTKFECGCFIFNKPHILVLCNCLPELHRMTKSRWILKTINSDFEMTDYAFENNDDLI